MRESKIESTVVRYAKSKGWMVFKFDVQRDSPDRIFMRRGETFFIEFKATGKKPRAGQQRFIDKLMEEGFVAFTIDDVDKGKELVDQMTGL